MGDIIDIIQVLENKKNEKKPLSESEVDRIAIIVENALAELDENSNDTLRLV